MKETLRRPKKGDNPFFAKSFDGRSPTWASLKWLAAWNINDSMLATAFKEAGDKIIKQLSTGDDPRHADIFLCLLRIFTAIALSYR